MVRLKTRVDRINELLYRKGLTKRALAKEANIGEVTVFQVCKGKRVPGPRIAKKIVDALGVEFDDLFVIEKVEKNSER